MIYDLEAKLKAVLENKENLKTVAYLTNSDVKNMKWNIGIINGNVVNARLYLSYEVPNRGRDIAVFGLEEMPGCGDVLISNGVYIHEYDRKKGLGKLMNAWRSEAAKKADATAIICTVREDNVGERMILHENGWNQLGGFTSKWGEKPHTVEMWRKQL